MGHSPCRMGQFCRGIRLEHLCLLAPLTADAVYQTPSELLNAIEYDGTPRSFAGEVHVSSDSEEVFVSVWLSDT